MKSFAILVCALLVSAGTAFADGINTSNDVIGKIFRWKADHWERALNLDEFPDCGDPKVLKKIVERYNWAEEHTWKRGILLDFIERPRERVTLAGGERMISRRYCRGHALLSNGRHPTVHYMISQRQGFASIKWNVEFCISGHDRWMAYDGSCRVLRR